jgi:hypothetical protein
MAEAEHVFVGVDIGPLLSSGGNLSKGKRAVLSGGRCSAIAHGMDADAHGKKGAGNIPARCLCRVVDLFHSFKNGVSLTRLFCFAAMLPTIDGLQSRPLRLPGDG